MKTMLVTLGDRPAVEVEVPEGKGPFWVYRDMQDKIFASRKPPSEMRNAFVLRHVRENGDTVYKPGEVCKAKKKVSKGKGKVSYGNFPWEDEAAS